MIWVALKIALATFVLPASARVLEYKPTPVICHESFASIRPMQPEDAQAVRRLSDKVPSPPTRRLNPGRTDQIFVSEDYATGEVNGFLAYGHTSSGAIEIQQMAVLPAYQGQGIGTSLIEQLDQFQKPLVAVAPGDTEVLRFFRRRGFTTKARVYPLRDFEVTRP